MSVVAHPALLKAHLEANKQAEARVRALMNATRPPPTPLWRQWLNLARWRIHDARERLALKIAPWLGDEW